MPRPKKDGTPARAKRKMLLTEVSIRRLKGEAGAYCAWDTVVPGLAVRVQPSPVADPTTPHKAFKFVYSRHSRPRWLHLGDVDKLALKVARRLAKVALGKVAEGQDPVADAQAKRNVGTFTELADRRKAIFDQDLLSLLPAHYRPADAMLPEAELQI